MNDPIKASIALALLLAACGSDPAAERPTNHGGADVLVGNSDTGASESPDGATIPQPKDDSPTIRRDAGPLPLFDLGAESDAAPSCPGHPSCDSTCTPWVEPAGSGCAAGEWCVPGADTEEEPVCVAATGRGIDSDRCGPGQPGCAAGHLCVLDADGDTVCAAVCDPSASTGRPGAVCGATQGCAPLLIDDGTGLYVDALVGTCVDACDYDGRVWCDSIWASCVPDTIAGFDFDVCLDIPSPGLDEFQDCAPRGLEPFELCGPTSMCLELGPFNGPPGLLCYELCRTDEGAFGEAGHPDCGRQTAACTQIFSTPQFGLCGPDV